MPRMLSKFFGLRYQRSFSEAALFYLVYILIFTVFEIVAAVVIAIVIGYMSWPIQGTGYNAGFVFGGKIGYGVGFFLALSQFSLPIVLSILILIARKSKLWWLGLLYLFLTVFISAAGLAYFGLLGRFVGLIPVAMMTTNFPIRSKHQPKSV